MKITTAINHKDTLVRRLDSLYRRAKLYHWSADQLQATRNLEIYGYEPYKRLPRWVKEYISGYGDCLYSHHWHHVEWVFPWDGHIYKNWSLLPEEGRKYYMAKDRYGLHVYKDDNWKHYTGSASQFKAGVKDVQSV